MLEKSTRSDPIASSKWRGKSSSKNDQARVPLRVQMHPSKGLARQEVLRERESLGRFSAALPATSRLATRDHPLEKSIR